MVTMVMSVLARFRAGVWHPRGRARQRWAGLAVGPETQEEDRKQFSAIQPSHFFTASIYASVTLQYSRSSCNRKRQVFYHVLYSVMKDLALEPFQISHHE